MKYRFLFLILIILCIRISNSQAQENALVNTSKSPHAVLQCVNIQDVRWTEGFWNDWFEVCEKSMVPHMMNNYMDAGVSHAFQNFLIAAKMAEGEHYGPRFHEGDF